jgi:hypothetical protein
MASVAMMVGGAILNAAAFTGGNVIAKALGGSDEERIRHDKAIEELTRARDEFNNERAKRLDMANKVLRGEKKAVDTFYEYDRAMQEYYNITKIKLDPLREPVLSDYYVASDEQKLGELVFIGVGMLGLGFRVLGL